MKIYVFALLVVAAIAVAFPSEEKDITVDSPSFSPQKKDDSLKLQEALINEHHRARRATCDLLSMFGVNHGACAAHCILKGKTGGRCNSDGVCVCRATSAG